MLKRLRSSTLAKNSSWMMAGTGTSFIVQSLYFVLLARLLGATEYGLLAGATALIQAASIYSSLGTGFIFMRHVSPDHSRFRAYWGYLLALTFTGGLVVVFVIVLIAHWVIRDLSLSAAICLALGDCLFAQITAGAGRVFQTFERMRYCAISNLLVNVLRLCAASAMFVLWRHATVTNWAVASVSASFIGSILAMLLVTATLGRPILSLRLLPKHFAEGFLFSSTTSTSSVYNDVDKVLLGHYRMNAANGIYAMAYKAIDTSFMVIRSINGAAFPRFCREGAAGIVATKAFAQKLLGKTVWISLAISVGLFCAAPLIPIFLGHGFAESVSALRFLALIPVFRCCNLAAGDALSSSGFQRYRFLYELGAAAGNLGINIWLIPRYSWRGAAASSLATDGALALVSWFTVSYLASRVGKRQVSAILT